jgi:uncharacterized membrane protein
MAEHSGTARRARDTVTEAVPTDELKAAGQQLLGLLVERAARSAIERVDTMSDRLDGLAERGGQGIGGVLGRHGGDGAGAAVGAAVGSALGRVKDGVKEQLKEGVTGALTGGGGQRTPKLTNIVESIDVGLPLRGTYNLWTRFADFPGFMKKVQSVEQSSETTTNWKAQVFLSHRTWEATITEQVPDSHIVWRSKGSKGHVDGAVSFTELGPNLTRVLLVLEYWPQGLFERTGNLWRAQGRRARLELKNFRRYAMTTALLRRDDLEGWRGEIRDSEVVQSHEEALERRLGAEKLDDEQDDEQLDEAEIDGEDLDADLDEDTDDVDIDDTDDDTDDEYEEDDGAYDEPEPDARSTRPARSGGRL